MGWQLLFQQLRALAAAQVGISSALPPALPWPVIYAPPLPGGEGGVLVGGANIHFIVFAGVARELALVLFCLDMTVGIIFPIVLVQSSRPLTFRSCR